MKLRHTIFNSIGLAVAGLAGLAFILNLIGVGHVSNGMTIWYLSNMLLSAIVVIGVGGAALTNLATGRLQPKWTWFMVIAYFLTCAFSLLAIWGMMELLLSGKRIRRRSETSTSKTDTPTFSFRFSQRAAHISWAGPATSFLVILATTAFHSKVILHVTILIWFFVLTVSMVLGVAALFSIRDHGKQGILAPALTGTILNGIFLTLIGLALLAGAQESLSHRKLPQQGNSPVTETNSVSDAK